MTPLALELEAFTCYRQRALVEWEGSDSGLFAVTGPTGAGKSTLLDAITYALYGQTARLGGRGLESLLSPGAPSMFVQLKFRAARGVFRVTRVAQRKASGVTTEVRVEEAVAGQDGAASWRQWQASESVRAANRAIEEIVGLDYSGFTRAVLLPQGAFDEFLRGDAGERRKLLVALLGLDRVERVRELASKLSREAEGVANGLERRLTEDYEDVSAEAIRALESHAATVKGEAAALELETNALDARLGVARERARLEGVLAALGRRREALAAASTRIAAVEKELAAARTAQALVPAIAAHERGADRAKSAALALEAAQSAATTLAEAATVARAGLLVAQNAHDERLPRLEGEQAAWQALAPALATLQRIGGDLTDLAEVGTGRMLVEEEWTLLQLVEGQLPHLARLESMAKGAADRVAAAAAAEAAASAAVATLKLELAERTAIGLRLKDEAQRLTAEREAAVMADAAAAVRAHVHVGDDCPVCGNRVSALPASGEPALAAADAAARKASEDLEAARAEYSRVNSSLAAASAKLTAAVSATSEARDAAVAATAAHEVAATALREQLAEAVDGDAATIDLGEAPALVAAARRAEKRIDVDLAQPEVGVFLNNRVVRHFDAHAFRLQLQRHANRDAVLGERHHRRDAPLDRRDFERVLAVSDRDAPVGRALVQILDAEAAFGERLPRAVEPVTLDQFVDAGVPQVAAALVEQLEGQRRLVNVQRERVVFGHQRVRRRNLLRRRFGARRAGQREDTGQNSQHQPQPRLCVNAAGQPRDISAQVSHAAPPLE